MADYNKELSKVRGPFRVYPKKKKEEPISTVDDYQKAFIKVSKICRAMVITWALAL